MITSAHTLALLAYSFLILFHVSLAPIVFNEISHRLVWYIGTDFGAVGFVAVNVAARRAVPSDRVVWWMCHAFNAGFVVFDSLNLYAVPQAVNIVVLAIAVTVAVTAWAVDLSRRPRLNPGFKTSTAAAPGEPRPPVDNGLALPSKGAEI
ncbi:MAG: hypothetical protein KDE14_08730 [Rhodobacteraceae bacterium]|nr:hypothetical protein [Paracoccaceae bacterium]